MIHEVSASFLLENKVNKENAVELLKRESQMCKNAKVVIYCFFVNSCGYF